MKALLPLITRRLSLVTRHSSLVTAVAVAAFAATATADPTVGQVLVHQLWPWSQNIKVEYTLSGTGGGVYDIAVTCREAGVGIPAAKVSSALCGGEGFHSIAGDGIHSFTLDPSKLIAEGATAITDFTVSIGIAGPGDPLGTRVEYRVFDLETGKVTDLRRRDIYDRPDLYGTPVTNYADLAAGFTKPADLSAADVFIVTNFNADAYKTTKLVMKRIPAANVEWYMGPSEDDPNAYAAGSWSYPRLGESRFRAKLTRDYFIGIFEVTQKQYEMVTGERPSFFTNETCWATRPVEWVSRSRHMNAETGFPAMASAMFGKTISLPTEAQWEFAAKAMYDGPGFPSGLELTSANLGIMEGYSSGRGHGGYPDAGRNDETWKGGTYKVGGGKPNPFGLYNMFGNVCEWCRDNSNRNLKSQYGWSDGSPAVSDPYNTRAELASGHYVFKGNSYYYFDGLKPSRCAWRGSDSNGVVYQSAIPMWGIRIVCPAD